MRKTFSDYAMDALAHVTVTIALIATLYPFVYTLSASISDPSAVLANKVVLWPVGFSLESYRMVFESNAIWTYYGNTLWYTGVGTLLSIIATCITAYPLALKHFFARKFFMGFVTIPMFISGGLIPYFLVVVNTGLYDSRWAMIIPSLISVFNLIICRTFFQSVPTEMTESAVIDGCSYVRVLFRIIMPLSKAVLAVLVIFYGVAQWNSWFNALLFLPDDAKQPVQMYLRRLLIQVSPDVLSKLVGDSSQSRVYSIFQLKYAVVMVVIGPIILVYPFLQKYFVTGVMLGSLKG